MNDDLAYRGGGRRQRAACTAARVPPRRREVVDPDLRPSHSDHRAGMSGTLGAGGDPTRLTSVLRSRRIRHGDMETLPYQEDTFDLVTGFNSFFFANDIVAAVREAGRVAKPGAPVVIQVWGHHESNALEAMRTDRQAVHAAQAPRRRPRARLRRARHARRHRYPSLTP
jgi:SAM-dependent methyltransferase